MKDNINKTKEKASQIMTPERMARYLVDKFDHIFVLCVIRELSTILASKVFKEKNIKK